MKEIKIMALFGYEAVDRTGKRVRGEIEASSGQEAQNKIRQMGYFPTNVQEKKAAPAGGAPGQGLVAPRKKGKGIYFGGVNRKQLTQVTQQLSVLQDAGLPLLRSLKILEKQLKPSLLKNIFGQLAEDVEGGSTFSEALSKHPKAFDNLYVNMVKAGEAGGVLDTILLRLAIFMEKSQALKRKVISALIYPIMVISVAVIILVGIMTYVVPKFAAIFDEMAGVDLPWVTQILLQASDVIKNWWFLFPLLPVLIYVTVIMMVRSHNGRLIVDRIKLKLPLVGGIIKKSSISRFCRTFGTLGASGVPILDSLSIVRNAIGNEVIAQAIQNVHDSIREGESIASPLNQSGVFDDIVINMIEVGEETGELDKMLMKVADNYEAEVDTAVDSLTSILEPAIIVFLGVTVGFIVVALFMPLITLMESIGNA